MIGLSLAAGLLAAVLFLSLSEGLVVGMLLSYLAPLPLMAAGLGRGVPATVAAAAIALVAVAAVSGSAVAVPFGLVVVLPSLVVVRQALLWRTTESGAVEWYPPGLLLGWLTGLAVALILVGAALVSGQGGLGVGEGGIQDWVTDVVGRTLDLLSPSIDPAQRQLVVGWWVPFFPAVLAGSLLVMTLVNAILAQAMLARGGRNRRPSPSLRDLELPVWLGVVLVGSALVGVVAEGDLGYLARSVAVVLLIPFVLYGLAGIHVWAAGRSNSRMILVAVYGVLFLASAWALMPVAGLGVARFVMRFRPPGDSGGGKEE